MRNLEKAQLDLTESQLLTIKDRIKNRSTKDHVLDTMRFRYSRINNHAT